MKKNTALRLNEDWYQALLEDVRAILVEHEFAARWAKLLQYHLTGRRILEETNRAPLKSLVSGVARDLSLSPRTVYRAVQFAKKYPDINDLPEGKAISWNKLCKKYLPEPKEKPCDHPTHLQIPYFKCLKCGKFYAGKDKRNQQT